MVLAEVELTHCKLYSKNIYSNIFYDLYNIN